MLIKLGRLQSNLGAVHGMQVFRVVSLLPVYYLAREVNPDDASLLMLIVKGETALIVFAVLLAHERAFPAALDSWPLFLVLGEFFMFMVFGSLFNVFVGTITFDEVVTSVQSKLFGDAVGRTYLGVTLAFGALYATVRQYRRKQVLKQEEAKN